MWRDRMAWRVHLCETVTGQILRTLKVFDQGSIQIGPINSDQDSIRGVAPYEEFEGLDHWVDDPWAGSILACWDDTPVQACVIDADPDQSMAYGPLSLSAGSIFKLLQQRIATDTDYPPGKEKELVESTWRREGWGLGTIGWELLQLAQQRPHGRLPIVLGSEYEANLGTPGRDREYYGFNVANNDVSKLLLAMTAVISGPDMRFQPIWQSPEKRGFMWKYQHGLLTNPYLESGKSLTLDLTAPRVRVIGNSVSTDWDPVSRVYVSGAGQGAGTLVKIRQIERLPSAGHQPWTERAFAKTDTTNETLLAENGDSILLDGLIRIVQLSVITAVDDPDLPIWDWEVGDQIMVRWPEGWRKIPAGEYVAFTLKRSISLASSTATTDIQFGVPVSL